MATEKGEDRAIGVNISMPQSLFNKINKARGSTDRSVFVREAIYRYLESIGNGYSIREGNSETQEAN